MLVNLGTAGKEEGPRAEKASNTCADGVGKNLEQGSPFKGVLCSFPVGLCEAGGSSWVTMLRNGRWMGFLYGRQNEKYLRPGEKLEGKEMPEYRSLWVEPTPELGDPNMDERRGFGIRGMRPSVSRPWLPLLARTRG